MEWKNDQTAGKTEWFYFILFYFYPEKMECIFFFIGYSLAGSYVEILGCGGIGASFDRTFLKALTLEK